MSAKLKISALIQQRLQDKKEREKANQPRLPVLRVMFENENRIGQELAELKDILSRELQQEEAMLKNKKAVVKQMSDMVREPHSKIRIEPDFFASEAIPQAIKDFYRKSSNSFLKMAILQQKAHNAFKEKQKMVLDGLKRIRQLEETLRNMNASHRKQKSDQLVNNMIQKLKYEEAQTRGQHLAKMIEDLHRNNQAVSKEYEFKKDKLDRMEEEVAKLKSSINEQTSKYQETYNVVKHREYMQRVFDLDMKISSLGGRVRRSYADVTDVLRQVSKLQDSLSQRSSKFIRYGHIETFGRRRSVSSRSCMQDSSCCEKSFGSGLSTTYFTSDRSRSGRNKQWSVLS